MKAVSDLMISRHHAIDGSDRGAAMAPTSPPTARPTPMTPAHANGSRFGRSSTKGLTLIELLVSVTILVIMILAFGTILSQGQKVVTRSQRIIRANAQAAAIAQVFRRDVASITTDGFLHIGSGDAPAMVFTSVGSFTSQTSSLDPTPQANAAVICYSGGNDSSTGAQGKILCREAHLLTKPAGAPAWNVTTSDITNLYLSDIQMEATGATPANIKDKFGGHASIPTLPTNLTDAQKTWSILVNGCTDVKATYRVKGGTTWSSAAKTTSANLLLSYPACF